MTAGGVWQLKGIGRTTGKGRYPSCASEENVRTLDGLETINCVMK
jgi:hypothetical protein